MQANFPFFNKIHFIVSAMVKIPVLVMRLTLAGLMRGCESGKQQVFQPR